MRSKRLLPLFMLFAAGCGRYATDSTHEDETSTGGSGGAPAGGSNAAPGGSGTSTGGTEASAGGAEASTGGTEAGSAGGSGAGGSGGAGPTRGRWLASETFVSSSSTQTALSLIDLAQPQADPVVLDSESATAPEFSGDGRWLLYEASRSTEQVGIYLVNVTGERPSAPQLLLRTRPHTLRRGTVPCQWAPDSSRLACLKDTGTADAPESTVVSFDTSGAELGPEVSIGPGERDLTFLDRDTLVYGSGANDFARVEWLGQTLSEPQPLGVGGGSIVQQSSDGARALVIGNPANSEVDLALIDFRLGQAQALDLPTPFAGSSFSLSTDFDAAFMVEAPPAGESRPHFYRYYAVNGTQMTQVGRPPIGDVGYSYYYRSAGPRLVHANGRQVFLDTVANGTFTEQAVPYQPGLTVIQLEIDPAGAWVYIGTGQFGEGGTPVWAEHWLSRIQAGQAEPAQRIGKSYLTENETTTVLFSPNSQRLLLHGNNTYPHQDKPTTFSWFDLSDPARIEEHILDLPFSWGNAAWSADSRYLSIIGGAPVDESRQLLVIDALAPDDPPRQIVSCDSNPAPLPGCPASATFQP